jgi:nitroimidazol reductase NimA-like FMN-containing flavoprotein (pyridoxamine 5'-phosphate oxidase superfamily)
LVKPAYVGTVEPPEVLIERDEVRSVGNVRWQELTREECFELLAGQQLGRVVLVDDRGPLALPVNFVLDHYTVLFRTDEGTKLEVASRGGRIAFEVDGADEATRTGWSVLVRGEVTEVTDPTELARVRQLPLSPWAPGPKDRYVRVLPTVLTGRRIALPEDAPWNNWWR